jgi:hypothetical protein
VSRIALSLLALVVAGACNGGDAIGPLSRATEARVQPSADQSSHESPLTEITFEKWFTTPPAMTGNTSLGAGTFSGRILGRTAFANGIIVQLKALYSVTDPSGGGHSFTAIIEGAENLQTQSAVLNGVVTEGWKTGARVHVTFDVITPCELGTRNLCFRGIIRVGPQG